MSRTRRLAAAAALAAALPALAYILPADAILRRVAEKRAGLSLASLEVAGTFQADAAAAQKLASVGLDARGELTVPARFVMKVPGRCRLELAPADVPEAERPWVAVRAGRVSGGGALRDVPAAVALVRSACALLAVSTSGAEPGGAYAAAVARRGVSVADESLGRFDGRLAYVIGGRATDRKPLLYVDKETYQPMRLVAPEGASALDVRFLGWGSPMGGDWFPRALEVHEGDALRVRLTTERAAANPKLADLLFP
jgi:hypothetical protein